MLHESLSGMAATVSSEVAPKGRKIALKMGVLSANLKKWRFAVFLAAKPSVLLRNSGLGPKVTQAW